jgi:hypothetical protein
MGHRRMNAIEQFGQGGRLGRAGHLGQVGHFGQIGQVTGLANCDRRRDRPRDFAGKSMAVRRPELRSRNSHDDDA